MKQFTILILVLLFFSCGKSEKIVSPDPTIESKVVKLAASPLVKIEDRSGGRTPQEEDSYLFVRAFLNGNHYAHGIIDYRGIDTLSIELVSVQPQAEYEIIVDAIRKGTSGGPYVSNDRVFDNNSWEITNEMSDQMFIGHIPSWNWNYRQVNSIDSATTIQTDPSELDVFVGSTSFFFTDITDGETITIDAGRMSTAIEMVAYNFVEGELLYEVGSSFNQSNFRSTATPSLDSVFHVLIDDRNNGTGVLATRLSKILNGDTFVLFQDNLTYSAGLIKRFEVDMSAQTETRNNPISVNILEVPFAAGDTISIN